jgi:RNA polymerase sigma-70 factor (ECF subfamily)
MSSADVLARWWPGGAPATVVTRVATCDPAHHEDFALVLACVEALPPALAELSERITAAARRVDPRDDELAQLVRTRLLTGDGVARLNHYDGSSPLSAWLRVITVRVAANARRGTQRELTTSSPGATASAVTDDPELLLLKLQYHAQFKEAFAAAVASLGATERTVLKLHALDGLALGTIGTMFRRDASTISRWLDQVRAQLEAKTREHLLRTVAAHELDSLLRLAQSQLSVGLSRLLASPAVTGTTP